MALLADLHLGSTRKDKYRQVSVFKVAYEGLVIRDLGLSKIVGYRNTVWLRVYRSFEAVGDRNTAWLRVDHLRKYNVAWNLTGSEFGFCFSDHPRLHTVHLCKSGSHADSSANQHICE